MNPVLEVAHKQKSDFSFVRTVPTTIRSRYPFCACAHGVIITLSHNKHWLNGSSDNPIHKNMIKSIFLVSGDHYTLIVDHLCSVAESLNNLKTNIA